jgi:hypothetical protein
MLVQVATPLRVRVHNRPSVLKAGARNRCPSAWLSEPMGFPKYGVPVARAHTSQPVQHGPGNVVIAAPMAANDEPVEIRRRAVARQTPAYWTLNRRYREIHCPPTTFATEQSPYVTNQDYHVAIEIANPGFAYQYSVFQLHASDGLVRWLSYPERVIRCSCLGFAACVFWFWFAGQAIVFRGTPASSHRCLVACRVRFGKYLGRSDRVVDAEGSALSAVSFYRAVDGATVDVPGEVGVAANQWVALCAQHGSRQM